MNDHVTKPIDTRELFTILEKWITSATGGAVAPDSTTTKAAGPDPAKISPGVESGDDGLPHILSGFDLAAGLKRLQGNRQLYRKLLLNFTANYDSTADDIQRALTAGDINQVHSLVHNIKGLAGNLSATRLESAAAEMDGFVKQVMAGSRLETSQLERSLGKLKAAIDEVLASCRELKQAAPQQHPRSGAEPIPSMPTDLAEQTAERLCIAADLGNITELKSIAEALLAESDNYTEIGNAIEQLTEDFDLEGITRLAEELVSKAKK
jgi:HPt (histidine-containing phosphotransfer) domain-containing protein